MSTLAVYLLLPPSPVRSPRILFVWLSLFLSVLSACLSNVHRPSSAPRNQLVTPSSVLPPSILLSPHEPVHPIPSPQCFPCYDFQEIPRQLDCMYNSKERFHIFCFLPFFCFLSLFFACFPFPLSFSFLSLSLVSVRLACGCVINVC